MKPCSNLYGLGLKVNQYMQSQRNDSGYTLEKATKFNLNRTSAIVQMEGNAGLSQPKGLRKSHGSNLANLSLPYKRLFRS